MTNSGPHSNNSQFGITFDRCEWLDGYQVVFGELVEGTDVLNQIESFGSRSGKPTKEIKISDCGVY